MARDVRRPLFRPLSVALGVACVLVGVWLLSRPFDSVWVLTLLVAAALVLSGLAEVASAAESRPVWLPRVIGVGWIGIGVVAVTWPDITLFGLATVVGVALVAGGLLKFSVAVLSDGADRALVGISGLTNVIIGVLALSWPSVTVLVLAVLFGFRTIVFGVGQVVTALRPAPSSPGAPGEGPTATGGPTPWTRWAVALGGLALALLGVVVSVSLQRAHPDEPGPFYSAPVPLPDEPPGSIIRSEVVDGFAANATTYRVLYVSTTYDGGPTAVSGLVIVPDAPAPAEGRKVVAFTHGTVGVAPACAPSLLNRRALVYEGLDAFIAAGYVVAASDYQGLGTPGPHPYLIGASEGMNELDIVRAAQHLEPADAAPDFVVWGHSQGGHAALFTAQLAATYAPELHLQGVAAGAPAPDLVELFKGNLDTTIGKVLISQALQSWHELFKLDFDDVVAPSAQPAVEAIARNCIYTPAELVSSAPGAAVLDLTFLRAPPWEVEPWKSIAAENRPGQTPIDVPILLTQGSADPLIEPALTEALAAQLCEQGETVHLRLLPGVEHVEAGHEAAPAVAAWIADRFAGEPAATTCPP